MANCEQYYPYTIDEPIGIHIFVDSEWNITQSINSLNSVSLSVSQNSRNSNAIITFTNLTSLYSKYDILRDSIQDSKCTLMKKSIETDITVHHIWKHNNDATPPQYGGAYFITTIKDVTDLPVCMRLFYIHDMILIDITVYACSYLDTMISGILRLVQQTFNV